MRLLEDKTGLPVMASVGQSHCLACSKLSVNAITINAAATKLTIANLF